MLAWSELGEWAQKLGYRSLVGAFYGHAHNQLCQLSHLTAYVPGIGLEDLKGCERFFSKSNALASLIQYTSVFHWCQRIVKYMKHMDTMETSQNLSKSLGSLPWLSYSAVLGEFLVNNYKQALKIIEGEADLKNAMHKYGIVSMDDFHQWLKEEKEYLMGLQMEPEEELLHINYYQALVKLSICKCVFFFFFKFSTVNCWDPGVISLNNSAISSNIHIHNWNWICHALGQQVIQCQLIRLNLIHSHNTLESGHVRIRIMDYKCCMLRNSMPVPCLGFRLSSIFLVFHQDNAGNWAW